MSDRRNKKDRRWRERRIEKYVYYSEIQEAAIDLGIPEARLIQMLEEHNVSYEHPKDN